MIIVWLYCVGIYKNLPQPRLLNILQQKKEEKEREQKAKKEAKEKEKQARQRAKEQLKAEKDKEKLLKKV